MTRKILVDCDDCGKILTPEDQIFMTTCQIGYKAIGKIEKPGEIPKKFISKSEVFDVQLCGEHATEFMNYVKEYFKKRGK